jgi:2-hydroxycyclohexanecarboxyl-CoA dehydrogenase
MLKTLEQSSAFVTGGTSGIGFASAAALIEAGVRRIGINGRNEDRGARAADSLRQIRRGIDVRFFGFDVTDALSSRKVIDEAAGEFGGIDVLVTSAGGNYVPRLFHEQDPTQFSEICASWFYGVLNCCHAVLPHMKNAGGGSIINIASDAAKIATPGETVIGGIMAAVVMFSRTLAIEAARHKIRVNAITPSVVKGTRHYRMVMSDPFCARLFGKAENKAHLGVAEPKDLAALVVFLAGPTAERLTGQAISVNGGISAA